MGKRVGLLAGLLVLLLGSGVVAQEPSPEPPPWFGGRVEMPEHGFAVTVPDGWFAMDTTTELDRQLDAVMEVGSLGEWYWGDPQELRDRMILDPMPQPLWMVDLSSGDSCAMSRGSVPVPAEEFEYAADILHDSYLAQPWLMDVEPPITMDLPAGPVLKMHLSMSHEALGSPARMTSYEIMTVRGILALVCTSAGTRPHDDWLSIAETIEFLPSVVRPSLVSRPDLPAPAQELRVGRSLGDPDAPVRIDVFEDPQCPPCGVFTQRIEPLLVAGPIARGEVFLTYKDFPFIGPESLDAAVAMRVAEGLGGKFWDYHQLVFLNQNGENQGAFSLDRLAAMAELIGLDRDAFLVEMANPEYLAAVGAEADEGGSLGINSTPSLVVNGTLMRGLPTWDDLSAEIEAHLDLE